MTIPEGVVLDGWMVKPADLDPSQRYPLLMFVYGEPANTTVQDAWPSRPGRMLFHRALAQAGYVVASVDNRGTPTLKGREWRKMIYGAVGVLASEEQAKAVRTLLAQIDHLQDKATRGCPAQQGLDPVGRVTVQPGQPVA